MFSSSNKLLKTLDLSHFFQVHLVCVIGVVCVVVFCQMLTFATVAPICLTFIWRFQPHVAQVPDILRLHNTTPATDCNCNGQSKSNAVHHLIALVVANWKSIEVDRVLQHHANTMQRAGPQVEVLSGVEPFRSSKSISSSWIEIEYYRVRMVISLLVFFQLFFLFLVYGGEMRLQ